MADQWDTEFISKPNWVDHIQFFFSPRDVQCMEGSMRLDSYESVRFFARRIYGVTEAGTMPMGAPDRRWSEFRLRTFYNWIKNGSPRTAEDESILENFRIELNPGGAVRVRKNLSAIDPTGDEMAKLKAAFQGIMDRSPGEPNSYFDVAGLHWYPAPATYCVHGEDRYNPWHRAYLLAFENALRSVPGCEEVTLPFWDIGSGEVPDVLFEEPFHRYVFQNEVLGDAGAIEVREGEETQRNTKSEIEAGIASPISRVRENIDLALGATTWLSFNGLPPFSNNIIGAHNTGHGICGDTLAIPNTAAFDPLFWFFHCNWDRLWWQWQRNARVQRLSEFKDLMARTGEDAAWLDDPVIGLIEPFGILSELTIDSIQLGVDYVLPPALDDMLMFNVWTAGRSTAERVVMAKTPKVMVRLEDFQRLGIPGSVLIELLAEDQVVATSYIFQSTVPENCPTCRKHGQVDIDFEVERGAIEGAEIHARVTCVGSKGKRTPVRLENCGSPTLSVRMPLDTSPRASSQ